MLLSAKIQGIIFISIFFGYEAIIFPQTPQGFKGVHEQHMEEFGRDYIPVPDLLKPSEVSPLVERSESPRKYVVGYHPYWRNLYFNSYQMDKLTVINYFNIAVGSDGAITVNNGWPNNSLINLAHNNGVRVQLAVTNFSSSSLSTLLGSPDSRSKAVGNIVRVMAAGNGDGVDIDFEGVPGNRRAQYVSFMRELRDTLDAVNPDYTLSMASPAVDWSNAYNYAELAKICDWLFIMGYNYHWRTGPTAGPVSPFDSNSGINLLNSVADYLTKTANDTDKIILGLPYYGFSWPTVSDGGTADTDTRGDGESIFYNEAKSAVSGFGRKWHDLSKSPWYSYEGGSGWFVTWYDDEESLAAKYSLAKNNNLKGVGMWALGYDDGFNQLWNTLDQYLKTSAPPSRPANFRITADTTGKISVSMKEDRDASSYEFFISSDGENYRLLETSTTPSIEFNDASSDSIYYFKAILRNGYGGSKESEVLAATGGSGKKILIVNGFDREEGVVPSNSHDYIKKYAMSLKKAGYSFDSASNEAVESGSAKLPEYDVGVWFTGSESEEDISLSAVEQGRIKKLLENGGKLFISGSNIGYDLVERGSNVDRAFYSDYLKAEYISNDVAGGNLILGILPVSEAGTFSGIDTFEVDDGRFGSYKMDSPDGILAVNENGSADLLQYVGIDPAIKGGAGVAYKGVFGGSLEVGAIVYLSFPFETIIESEARDSLMKLTMDYLLEGSTNPKIPGDFRLSQNYPNPFNPGTRIEFKLLEAGNTKLTIYDIRGRTVAIFENGELPSGKHHVDWDGTDNRGRKVSSGVYFYQLNGEGFTESKKMVFMK